MEKLKVITIIGTRPEIIRLSRIIPKIDIYCKHTLVHTGQNYDYELNEIFFEDLNLRMPDYFLKAAGLNANKTIGKIIISFDEILEKIKPDCLLVLGDTNSCLAVIPAKRRKIPIFHMEAGNRCFDMRVPEEINRKIVDHTSDINLTYSSIARDYLIQEGVSPEKIIKTGSPMMEVLKFYEKKITSSNILNKLELKKEDYFLVSFHREENVESETNFKKFLKALNTICSKYKKQIIVSTHPRTSSKLEKFEGKVNSLINFLKPLRFTDYINLQINSIVVLSDSGTISEESSICNFPAINIRETHERPEGMEESSVIMTGLNVERIIQGIELVRQQGREKNRSILPVSDYMTPNVSEKVARIILSYIAYINRNVWKKNN